MYFYNTTSGDQKIAENLGVATWRGWVLAEIFLASKSLVSLRHHRKQARTQDFGQAGPVEFWPQGGPELKICSK